MNLDEGHMKKKDALTILNILVEEAYIKYTNKYIFLAHRLNKSRLGFGKFC